MESFEGPKKRVKTAPSLPTQATSEDESEDKTPLETWDPARFTAFESNTREIAPEGKLLLVVGPEKRAFRVHTLFLQNCSPKLSEIITGALENAAKDQDVSQDQIRDYEVSFPDDDADAFSKFSACIFISQIIILFAPGPNLP